MSLMFVIEFVKQSDFKLFKYVVAKNLLKRLIVKGKLINYPVVSNTFMVLEVFKILNVYIVFSKNACHSISELWNILVLTKRNTMSKQQT